MNQMFDENRLLVGKKTSAKAMVAKLKKTTSSRRRNVL